MKKVILTLGFLSMVTMWAFAQMSERIILLNEGNWQSNNARLSYFENGNIVSNKWFEEKNGYGIGDTPNDMIQVKEDLIAIAVNCSGIIQFIKTDGTAVAATEDVPNNRRLATDGEYLYVTSYAHECNTREGTWTCQKGYVAKISLATFKVEQCCEVGYEPEGIAYYEGHLFVANSGGYGFQEGHDYERTVTIVNAATMTKIKDIDTDGINLYGKMSQAGRYLCINATGDYYEIPAKTIVMDCQKALQSNDCIMVIDKPATYNSATPDGKFFVVGSEFSYTTYGYQISVMTIDPQTLFLTQGAEGVAFTLPGTVESDLGTKVTSPYDIYVNPYSGYIYITDAVDYVSAGKLHQWTSDGTYINQYGVYISPAHMLALGDWSLTDVKRFFNDTHSCPTRAFDIQGIPVTKGCRGIVVKDGKKYVRKH